jgi:L,D-peptidoglycan transpeptidase YkuD (ErfK/YbiS/YcfS/YnhG family)|tara:strand:- start:46 stop:534 length:489 start_codon:yes stop_codon:yes gene_type:complete
MHIKLVKKKLIFNKYKVKCALGKRGISIKKKEGDGITPKGTFKLKEVFYRRDRIGSLKTTLKKTSIKKNMGWCDDPKSKKYNRLIKLPSNYRFEKLHLSKNIYDVIVVINFNLRPVIKNKGSAIFIHLTKDYKATKGCISISIDDMRTLLKLVNNKSYIKII